MAPPCRYGGGREECEPRTFGSRMVDHMVDVKQSSFRLRGAPKLGAASGSQLTVGGRTRPGPRQQIVQLLHGPAINKFCQDISKVSERVHAVQFCCLDKRRKIGPVLGTFVVAGEQTVLPTAFL